MCVFLCNFITCVDSCNHYHNKNTDIFHRHKDSSATPPLLAPLSTPSAPFIFESRRRCLAEISETSSHSSLTDAVAAYRPLEEGLGAAPLPSPPPSPCPTAQDIAFRIPQRWQNLDMTNGAVTCVIYPGWSLRNVETAHYPALSHFVTWVPKQIASARIVHSLPVLTAVPLSLKVTSKPWGWAGHTLPFLLLSTSVPRGPLFKVSSSQFSVPSDK